MREARQPKRHKPIAPLDQSEMGPAMQALPNDQWRLACRFRFEVRSNSDAVRLAGYKCDHPDAAKYHAYRLFGDERMQRALQEEGARILKGSAPNAIQAVNEICDDPKHKNRLDAAKFLLGYAHPTESLSRVEVTHRIDATAAALEEIAAFRRLGIARNELEKIYGRDGLWHLEQQLDKPKMIEAKVVETTP